MPWPPAVLKPQNLLRVSAGNVERTIDMLEGGTEYAVVIRSKVGASTGEWSGPRFATARYPKLSAPVVMATVSATQDWTIDLAWAAITNADGYEVQYREKAAQGQDDFDWTDVATHPSSAAYRFLGPEDEGRITFEFRARATDTRGTESSDWSAVAEARTRQIAPGAPSGLSLAAGTADGGIVATWLAGANAAGYDVEWKQTTETVWQTATTALLTHDIPGVAGATYDVRVRSTRPYSPDASAYISGQRAAINLPVPAPSFTLGAGDEDGENRVTGYSAPATEQHTVQVQQRTGDAAYAKEGSDIVLEPNDTLDIEHEGVAGTTYDYQVRVKRPHAVFGEWSAAMSRQARNLAPVQVQGVSASDGDVDGEIDLSWTAVTNATGYIVEHRVDGTEDWTTEPEQAGAAFAFDGTAGTTYDFRVKAVRTHADDGEWSDVDSETAQNEKAAAPSLDVSAGEVDGAVVVEVTAPAGQLGDVVIQWRSGSTWSSEREVEEEITTAGGTATRTLSLVAGTSYTVRARLDRPNAPEGNWSAGELVTATALAPGAPSVRFSNSPTEDYVILMHISGGMKRVLSIGTQVATWGGIQRSTLQGTLPRAPMV